MATIRVKKEIRYSMIDNFPLQDSRLSWAARGLLVYLLSRPDNWQVNTQDLIRQSPAGEHAVNTLIKELKKFKYMKRVRFHDPETGKFRWITDVYERPAETDETTIPQSSMNGKLADIQITDSEMTEKEKEKDSSAAAAADKPVIKSVYAENMERLESVYADARGLQPPAWNTASGSDKAVFQKRWRSPLNRMLKFAGGDMIITETGIRAAVQQLKQAKMTFALPDQIEKTFQAWYADHLPADNYEDQLQQKQAAARAALKGK